MKSTADVDFAFFSVEEVHVFIEDIILSLFHKATGANKISLATHRIGNSVRFRCAKEMRFKYFERLTDTAGKKRLFQAIISIILYYYNTTTAYNKNTLLL